MLVLCGTVRYGHEHGHGHGHGMKRQCLWQHPGAWRQFGNQIEHFTMPTENVIDARCLGTESELQLALALELELELMGSSPLPSGRKHPCCYHHFNVDCRLVRACG